MNELILSAKGSARVGDLTLEIDIQASTGEIVGLVGPNGAGKSATLAVLLGFLPLEPGSRISTGGRTLEGRGRGVAPHQRGLGWCPQVPALLPRRRPLAQVMAFASGDAPKIDGTATIRESAARILDILGLDTADRRRPHEMSIGEQQRVAVARALCAAPVALLDEPTSAQDDRGAGAVRRAIRDVARAGGSVVVVSHRPFDAYSLADRMVVLDRGRIVQRGTPAQLASRPMTPYVARVVGATVLNGIVDEGGRMVGGWGTLQVPEGTRRGFASAVIRPAAVQLFPEPPTVPLPNLVAGPITALVSASADIRVEVGSRPSMISSLPATTVGTLGLKVGQRVWVSVEPDEVLVTTE